MKYYTGNIAYYVKKHPIATIIYSIIFIIVSYNIFNNYLRPIEKNPLIDKDSIHYVNDLYYSSGSFYNELLSADEKLIYKDMLNDIKKNKSSRKFTLDTYNCNDFYDCNGKIYKVYSGLFIDHPELLSFGEYSFRQANDTEVIIRYKNAIHFKILTNIHEKRIARIIDDIKKATTDMRDYEKVKYVYEWISKKKYDKVFTFSATNQSAYNVFIKGKAVCAGFAKASQLIFQNIEIESYIVLGSTNGLHAWNIVKVENEYYYFDSTVGASIRKDSTRFYDGLNGFFENYSQFYKEIYPELSKEKLISK